MRELAELRRIGALLSWDQQTKMPPRGAEARARARATIRVLQHRRLVDPALGELLEGAPDADLDAHQAACVRLLLRDHRQAVRLSDELVRRMALAAGRGQAAWEEARRQSDYEIFKPHLAELVDLKREHADLLGHDGVRYDALLDLFEPGMRVEPPAPTVRLTERRAGCARRRHPGRATAAAAAVHRPRVRRPAAVGLHHAAACRPRLRPGGGPPGSLGAPVLDRHRAPRRPGHHPDLPRRPVLVGLLDDPRGGPRHVQPGTGRALRGPAGGRRAIAGRARVAVAPVGEHRRAQPPLLGALHAGHPRVPGRHDRRGDAWTTSIAMSTGWRRR